MATVSTNDGVSLHVTEDGEGPAVLLVAGFTAPATSWALQVDALVAAGYRAVCVDRRSHGLSEAPWYGQRVSRHGKDLHDVIDALDLDDVVLVGASMGASAIWAYLDLFGTDGVRGVVTVDQTPRMINDDGWQHGFYGLTPDNAGTMFAEGVPATGRGRTLEQMMPAIVRLTQRVGEGAGLGAPIRPETLPLLRDHAQQDWRDVLPRCGVPMLLVAGRESQLWPCEHAEASVVGAAHARAVVLEDCGHAVNIEQPEAFNAELLGFLGDLG